MVACTGTKKFTQEGIKYETAGLVEEAADAYFQAVVRKRTNIEAAIGLKRVGQKVLNKKTDVFYKNFSLGNNKEAVYDYQHAQNYNNKIKNIGVILDYPTHYEKYYTEAKDLYVKELYTKAQQYMSNAEYKKSEDVLAELLKFDPNYKDAEKLKTISIVEPIYANGLKLIEEAKYIKAYYNFDEVTKHDPNYKEVAEYKQLAKEKGTISIGVLSAKNQTNSTKAGDKLYGYVISSLLKTNHPLLKLVDRDNIQHIMDEQKRGMQGITDEKNAVSTGKLIGIQNMLLINVIDASEQGNGRITSTTRSAYSIYYVETINPQTKLKMREERYNAINYLENTGYASASYGINYRIVSTETGELLTSEVIKSTKEDNLNYYTYNDGDYRNLIPNLPGQGQNININQWRNNFTKKRALKSTNELADIAAQEVGEQTANSIINFLFK